MTDYYTQFFTELVDLTDEELDWLDERIEGLVESDEWDESSFDYELSRHTHCMELYSVDYGNLEEVADFIQVFLKKFRPDQQHSMTWSCSSTRAELDAHDGGAVGITATEQIWVDPLEEVEKKLRRLKEHVNSNV